MRQEGNWGKHTNLRKLISAKKNFSFDRLYQRTNDTISAILPRAREVIAPLASNNLE